MTPATEGPGYPGGRRPFSVTFGLDPEVHLTAVGCKFKNDKGKLGTQNWLNLASQGMLGISSTLTFVAKVVLYFGAGVYLGCQR